MGRNHTGGPPQPRGTAGSSGNPRKADSIPTGHRGRMPGRLALLRRALSLGTWLLILGMVIFVSKGMDQTTFTRLASRIRAPRPESAAIRPAHRPPDPVTPPQTPAPAESPATAETAASERPDPVADPVQTPPPEAVPPPPIAPSNPKEPGPQVAEVILFPYGNGNYYVKGAINGQEVVFVVDTGASAVSIPDKLRWKLKLTQGGYLRSATANGITAMYKTEIKDLAIGPINLRNVPALLNPNAPDETILLGMTALRQVRMLQQDGRMVLQQDLPLEAAAEPSSPAPPPQLKIRKSAKDCMGDDKVINARVLRCMEGNEDEENP